VCGSYIDWVETFMVVYTQIYSIDAIVISEDFHRRFRYTTTKKGSNIEERERARWSSGSIRGSPTLWLGKNRPICGIGSWSRIILR
jgi:hypothetical protein